MKWLFTGTSAWRACCIIHKKQYTEKMSRLHYFLCWQFYIKYNSTYIKETTKFTIIRMNFISSVGCAVSVICVCMSMYNVCVCVHLYTQVCMCKNAQVHMCITAYISRQPWVFVLAFYHVWVRISLLFSSLCLGISCRFLGSPFLYLPFLWERPRNWDMWAMHQAYIGSEN